MVLLCCGKISKHVHFKNLVTVYPKSTYLCLQTSHNWRSEAHVMCKKFNICTLKFGGAPYNKYIQKY